jgi:nicotinate phosphoribosyltransferase
VRRRFSGAWHREVVATLAQELPEYFKGTSCVLLARDLGLVPIGTMAHEYLQTFQAVGVQLRWSQKAALERWVQEYRGDLGTALTDVIGMDAFLADFDLYFAKLFDGLDLQRALALYRHFADRTQLGFGIGTNLTNDMGLEPLQVVMKLVEANGQPVAKLSDSPEKNMCDDPAYLAYLRQVFEIKPPAAQPAAG